MSAAIEPVLVGYDGSPGADLALEWAVSTVAVTSRPLQVGIVGTHMDPVLGDFRAHNEQLVDAWRQRAFGILEPTGLPGWDVEVHRGPTGPVLLAAASRAHLLVVGSRGHGLLAGSLGGSVSQHVVRHATRPVVVVRPVRHAGARRIVVGMDGSDAALAALRFAVARARQTREALVVAHAHRGWFPPVRGARSLPGPADPAEETDRVLHAAAEAVRSELDGIELSTTAAVGSASRLLVDLSIESSLVVVGARGRDAFTEVLLGSVAQEVLHRAESPVAVVR